MCVPSLSLHHFAQISPLSRCMQLKITRKLQLILAKLLETPKELVD